MGQVGYAYMHIRISPSEVSTGKGMSDYICCPISRGNCSSSAIPISLDLAFISPAAILQLKCNIAISFSRLSKMN